MPEPSSVIRWDLAVLVGASVDYLSMGQAERSVYVTLERDRRDTQLDGE